MKAVSHRLLGLHLARHYLQGRSPLQLKAFQLGCVEPDKNPATYLKGSIRAQMLRGHNYRSAKKYIQQLCRRLRSKGLSSLWDYYTLGKLIHYIADAFTYPHNDHFPGDLKAHREYESALHACLAKRIHAEAPRKHIRRGCPAHFITLRHRQYAAHHPGIHTDAAWILDVCTTVTAMLAASKPRDADAHRTAAPSLR